MDLRDDVGGLCDITVLGGGDDLHWGDSQLLAMGLGVGFARGGQSLASGLRILGESDSGIAIDYLECATQDRRKRSTIFAERNVLYSREMTLEMFEGASRRAAEAIDRLIGITDGEYILFFSAQQLRQSNLCDIGILKFVNQNESRILTGLRQRGRIGFEQANGAGDHLTKGSKIILGEHAGDAAEYCRNLLATGDQFRHRQLFCVFRLGGARRRNLACDHLLYVPLVLIDVDEFVFATREEGAKVVQEFPGCRRLDEELEGQFVQSAPQVDEQVEVVDDFEASFRILQQPECIRMEGRGAKSNISAEFRCHSRP